MRWRERTRRLSRVIDCDNPLQHRTSCRLDVDQPRTKRGILTSAGMSGTEGKNEVYWQRAAQQSHDQQSTAHNQSVCRASHCSQPPRQHRLGGVRMMCRRGGERGSWVLIFPHRFLVPRARLNLCTQSFTIEHILLIEGATVDAAPEPSAHETPIR
jgi:hypothetical protein